MLEPRPTIWCLAAKLYEGRIIGEGPDQGRDYVQTEGWPKLVRLEEAPRYKALGFTLIRDPWSEEDFAMWERELRAMRQETERQRKASRWGWGV